MPLTPPETLTATCPGAPVTVSTSAATQDSTGSSNMNSMLDNPNKSTRTQSSLHCLTTELQRISPLLCLVHAHGDRIRDRIRRGGDRDQHRGQPETMRDDGVHHAHHLGDHRYGED